MDVNLKHWMGLGFHQNFKEIFYLAVDRLPDLKLPLSLSASIFIFNFDLTSLLIYLKGIWGWLKKATRYSFVRLFVIIVASSYVDVLFSDYSSFKCFSYT